MISAYPQVRKNFLRAINEWVEIDEEAFNEYMNCCPLARFHYTWFIVSQEDTLLNNGESVKLACKKENGKFFAKLMTLKQYDSRDTIKPDYSQIPPEVKALYLLDEKD